MRDIDLGAGKIPSEHDEQVRFVRWFRQMFPGELIFAIPNGGSRDPREVKRLQDEGVTPGIPDLFLPARGLWIEMKKAKGGVVSKAQHERIAQLIDYGYEVVVCHGAAQAQAAVLERCAG